MSKHTPGPWTTRKPGKHAPIQGIGVYANELARYAHDACVSLVTANIETREGSRKGEAKANARLIAAAPEMLEALKASVAAGMVPTPDSFPNTTKTEVGRVSLLIYAAISKAEGGTHEENAR